MKVAMFKYANQKATYININFDLAQPRGERPIYNKENQQRANTRITGSSGLEIIPYK